MNNENKIVPFVSYRNMSEPQNIMHFKYLITALVICFISACSTTSHFANTVEKEETVKFQNKWKKGEFIVSNYKDVTTSSKPVSEIQELWIIEPVENKSLVRIRSMKDESLYLHVENGVLELGEIKKGWWSAQWAIINHGNFVRIKNAWKINHYLNIENGQLESSPVKDGWHSAMWHIEVAK